MIDRLGHGPLKSFQIVTDNLDMCLLIVKIEIESTKSQPNG